MNDLKRDYLVKTFSRTKRKDYENYILNAIWHKLNNEQIHPVTQQYVLMNDGKYALLDLYFPQINYAVECDEGYHVNNKGKDIERELSVQEKLSAIDNINPEFGRIDATASLTEINNKINEIVKIIENKYKEAGNPSWECGNSVEQARNNRKITVKEDLHFGNIYKEIYQLFGKNPASNSRVRCTFNVSESAFVWCPKMAIEDDGRGEISGDKKWFNQISADRRYIYEKANGEDFGEIVKRYGDPGDKRCKESERYVFGKSKNCLGEIYYKFLGIYKFDKFENNTAYHKLINSELDLSPYI